MPKKEHKTEAQPRRVRKYPRGARGVPKKSILLLKSKHMQRWFLKNPWIKPMLTFNLAIIKMQALIRRFIVRNLGAKQWRKKLYKKRRSQPSQLNRYLANLDFYSRSKRNKPAYLDDGYSTWCAVRIQAWWRMVPKRRHFFFYVKDIYQIGSIQIQNTWRRQRSKALTSKLAVSESGRVMHNSSSANLPRTTMGHARAIQMAWRRHCSIRVYRYFKDLILHKLKGAPNDLLRCIIPGEADILDRASGVHVRFRLGGHIFPPKIYYKIYTHRPLCDLNAFAPRNYANESLTEPASLHLNPPRRDQPLYKGVKEKYAVISTHMRVGGALYDATVSVDTGAGGTRDWYKREDRNFWRPISHEATDDPMFETPYKSMSKNDESMFKSKKMRKAHYHFSRFKRQEDVLRDKKKKKREWMLKAYMFSAGTKGQDIDEEREFVEGVTPISQRRQRHYSPREDNSSSLYDNNSNSSPLNSFLEERRERERRQGGGTGDDARHLLLSDSFSDGPPDGGEMHDELMPLGVFSNPVGGRDEAGYHARVCTDVTEDEDLLKWSQALDFEVYNANWAEMAVSMPSDYNYGSLTGAASTAASVKKTLHVTVDH